MKSPALPPSDDEDEGSDPVADVMEAQVVHDVLPSFQWGTPKLTSPKTNGIVAM